MNHLAIDIETYSSVDLVKCGVHKYCASPDFEILLFACSSDDGPVQVWDFTDPQQREAFIFSSDFDDILSHRVLKTAHNAAFERTALAAYFGLSMPAEQWECTQALVAQCGLPLSLDAASKALGLDAKKDAAGKALIKYFSMPCKPTKANGGRTRNLPHHDAEKWAQFIEYCRQDVVVEQAIREKLKWFKPVDTERRVWILDQQINDRGVMVDPVLVENAIDIYEDYRDRLIRKAIDLTGVANPNSRPQLLAWLREQIDEEVPDLKKETVAAMVESNQDEVIKQVLEIRQMISKASIKKYYAMLKMIGRDLRIRGLFTYCGANRTGRWSGAKVQPQNLTKNPESKEFPQLDDLREMVREGDLDSIDLIFGNVPEKLSWLIRTAFVAKPGYKFIPSDFSAIEARVIAWLAGEKWRMDVFNTHGKIYEASAAQMFKVPLETIRKDGPNYHLRAKGKIAELALGYQGGVGALEKMGALKMGLTGSELPRIVALWRAANRKIVDLWDQVNVAAIGALKIPGVEFKWQIPNSKSAVKFYMKNQEHLIVELPSGRRLVYQNARLFDNRFGLPAIKYQGMDQTKKTWGWQETYGGKLVENITQAIARDLLADAMLRLDDAGHEIAIHVHDEVVIETKETTAEEVARIMGQPIPWAAGLPLKADAYETIYYKKD